MITLPVTMSAREIVMLANSPSFLLHRLQKDPSVHFAVQSRSPHDVDDRLTHLLSVLPSTSEELTEAYIALIALSITGDEGMWENYSSIMSRIHWGAEMYALLSGGRADFVRMETPQKRGREQSNVNRSQWVLQKAGEVR